MSSFKALSAEDQAIVTAHAKHNSVSTGKFYSDWLTSGHTMDELRVVPLPSPPATTAVSSPKGLAVGVATLRYGGTDYIFTVDDDLAKVTMTDKDLSDLAEMMKVGDIEFYEGLTYVGFEPRRTRRAFMYACTLAKLDVGLALKSVLNIYIQNGANLTKLSRGDRIARAATGQAAFRLLSSLGVKSNKGRDGGPYTLTLPRIAIAFAPVLYVQRLNWATMKKLRAQFNVKGLTEAWSDPALIGLITDEALAMELHTQASIAFAGNKTVSPEDLKRWFKVTRAGALGDRGIHDVKTDNYDTALAGCMVLV